MKKKNKGKKRAEEFFYKKKSKLPLLSVPSSTTIEVNVLTELHKGKAVALATIASRTGSAPRLPGAKLILTTDGSLHGTVGGGFLEAQVIEACRRVLTTGQAQLLSFNLNGQDIAEDMICGGVVQVLVERVEPAAALLFEEAIAITKSNNMATIAPAWLVDITNATTPLRVLANKTTQELPNAIWTQTHCRTTELVEIADRRFLIDPLIIADTLLLCGGGHLSVAVADLAHQVGFIIEVVDDRPAFASAERFPMALTTRVLPGFAGACSPTNIGPNHSIAILTRGHHYDLEVLAQALTTSAHYIGMIGSHRKRDAIYTTLYSRGFSSTDLARVHSPIGLHIGAETPMELAISIVAELIAIRTGIQNIVKA